MWLLGFSTGRDQKPRCEEENTAGRLASIDTQLTFEARETIEQSRVRDKYLSPKRNMRCVNVADNIFIHLRRESSDQLCHIFDIDD